MCNTKLKFNEIGAHGSKEIRRWCPSGFDEFAEVNFSTIHIKIILHSFRGLN